MDRPSPLLNLQGKYMQLLRRSQDHCVIEMCVVVHVYLLNVIEEKLGRREGKFHMKEKEETDTLKIYYMEILIAL